MLLSGKGQLHTLASVGYSEMLCSISERLGKAYLKIIVYNYEPSNDLFSKGTNVSCASNSIESSGAAIQIPSFCCDLDGLKWVPLWAQIVQVTIGLLSHSVEFTELIGV
ncbi:unnamed protein product [Blepharisma stoltei]|uniref:Uncharacterized protein n=1 Tax=Blepharisma stoltei TaxID=1481888 RepID=A0AAU9INV2_9CILI|nr:unnamed protein product [Blepharisma stoltei]